MGKSEIYHLKRLQSNEEESFKWIYDNYHEKVYHYSLRFVQIPAIAKEITSDTFLKIWQKRAKIDSNRPIASLLFKITKDYTIDYLRKVSRSGLLRDAFIRNYVQQINNNLEEDIYFKEYLSIAEKAIENLPPKRKMVFNMKYKEHLDKYQIADMLGITPNTVKVHLAKAKQFIKNYLQTNSDIVFLFLFASFFLNKVN